MMRTLYVNEKNVTAAPCVATIGFFDGVHRGHRFLIDHVAKEARKSGLEAVVITFDRHPRQVLHSDYIPQLLSPLELKLQLLAQTPIDTCAVLQFNEQLSHLSAHDFMEQVLRDRLNVKKLVIGYDNRFGHNRSEGFDDYVRFGKELGMEVLLNPAFIIDGIDISSSVIRSLLKEGDVDRANRYLGYPYTISGNVVKGFQEGRKLGFPTANISLDDAEHLIPACGVYGVKALLDESEKELEGMMYIGRRPTFNGHTITLEVNLFNFSDDIYGHQLQVGLLHRIRKDQKFNNTAELAQQMKQDELLIKSQFEKEKNNE